MNRTHLLLFLKGMAMGAANVVPGVSGGTIALITGIFEELIDSIKSFDLAAIRLLLRFRIREFWAHVNGTFLIVLFAGVGVSIFSLAKLFKALLENENPAYGTWLMAFFFGLILISVWQVGRTIGRWSPGVIVALIVGLGAAASIALLTPASENESLWYLLVCGVAAMCSMILPGLSGSFVLIIMGNYKLIMLDAVSHLNLGILLPVALGAVLGLVVFARVLSWVFKHYRDITIALMTGFILGSLSIIWPWKNELFLMDEAGELLLRKGKPVISGYEWLMPDLSSRTTWVALLMIVLGAVLVWQIEYWGQRLAPPTAPESHA
ncbi:MAG: DUF368 domain-containing protein [Bacteroidetes bacterium]|nr:MAG: DUF368 domain-containing protein [Bacteroidota bacterium]